MRAQQQRSVRLARRTIVLFVLSASLPFVAACQSSSTSVVAPTDPKCQVSLAMSGSSLPAGGGSVTVNVATTRECAWSASADVP